MNHKCHPLKAQCCNISIAGPGAFLWGSLHAFPRTFQKHEREAHWEFKIGHKCKCLFVPKTAGFRSGDPLQPGVKVKHTPTSQANTPDSLGYTNPWCHKSMTSSFLKKPRARSASTNTSSALGEAWPISRVVRNVA